MYYYLNIFFVFSLIGHIIENFVYMNVDSGILYGLWTPIYGIGTISILIINKYIDKYKFNSYIKAIVLFLFCSLILGIIETIGGYYIEFMYGRVFWDYSHHFIPIGKYTSLQMMTLWGFAGIGLIYILFPTIEKLIKKIPKWVTYLLILLFVIDLIYTYIKLANILSRFF